MTSNGISIETPLVFSQPLSKLISRDVYLKLESTQPSGSFKLRGIANSCIKQLKAGCTKFVGSSGGNAGLALAYAAAKLNVPCEIFVPVTVLPRMLEKIRSYRTTTVTITGKIWLEAHEAALEACKDPQVGYLHPYDDPYLWEAYAEMVVSTKAQLEGRKPSCFVVSVAGGGLLLGILHGLEKVGWKDVPVVAMESDKADCFNLSIKAGHIVVKHPTSIAKTLGASTVAPTLMEWLPHYNILSHVLSDRDAVRGSVKLADDHGILVEPSCGITLSAIYEHVIPNILEQNGCDSEGPVVVIVCGGSDVTPEILLDFVKDFDL